MAVSSAVAARISRSAVARVIAERALARKQHRALSSVSVTDTASWIQAQYPITSGLDRRAALTIARRAHGQVEVGEAMQRRPGYRPQGTAISLDYALGPNDERYRYVVTVTQRYRDGSIHVGMAEVRSDTALTAHDVRNQVPQQGQSPGSRAQARAKGTPTIIDIQIIAVGRRN